MPVVNGCFFRGHYCNLMLVMSVNYSPAVYRASLITKYYTFTLTDIVM